MARRDVDRSQVLAALRDKSRGERIQKVLADAGVGSRRSCEQMIADGLVEVNGVTARDLPLWVDVSEDHIVVDGRPLMSAGGRRGRLYLMVFKPRGVISTSRDPEGRKRVIDLVPHTQRLYCVGRLDADSSGLVLLTNDGELTHRLTHPRYGVAKTYLVTIKGRLESEDVEKLREGIWLADRRAGGGQSGAMKAKAASVVLKNRDVDRSLVQITLREGRNREIRRMLVRLGHPVKKLRRVAIGPVKLKGVPPGGWRELTLPEVNALRKAARRGRDSR